MKGKIGGRVKLAQTPRVTRVSTVIFDIVMSANGGIPDSSRSSE